MWRKITSDVYCMKCGDRVYHDQIGEIDVDETARSGYFFMTRWKCRQCETERFAELPAWLLTPDEKKVLIQKYKEIVANDEKTRFG